ncbi:MAG: hypothetical protein QOG23_4572 [Blastocatellia bacterium]|nr:hypothetical protein [Blastocatellia bacterium]
MQSSLDRLKFKSGLSPSLGWEIAKIIETRTNESQGFHLRDYTSREARLKLKQSGQARFERILKDDTRRCLPALRRSPPT